MESQKYLFLLCTPSSGSTVLWRLLCTSRKVTALPCEGQWMEGMRGILGTPDRWNPEKFIPWPEARTYWHGYWNPRKP